MTTASQLLPFVLASLLVVLVRVGRKGKNGRHKANGQTD